MIDTGNFFSQPIRDDLKEYFKEVSKISTDQDDDTTGCLLDYFNFKEHYKPIALDLSKQPALDVDLKTIQKILLEIWNRLEIHNVFHSWGNERKYFGFFTRKSKSILNVFHLIFFTLIQHQYKNDSI